MGGKRRAAYSSGERRAAAAAGMHEPAGGGWGWLKDDIKDAIGVPRGRQRRLVC